VCRPLGHHLLADGVELDVVGGRVQEERVVAEQAEALVAPLAQQPTDLTGRVVVVQVLRFGIAADGAAIVLGRTQRGDLGACQLVLPVEVAGRVRVAVARPAT